MKNCIPSLEYQVIHNKLAMRCQNNDSTMAFLMLCQDLGCGVETGVLAQKLKMDLYRPIQRIFCKIKTMDLSFNHF